MILRICGLKDKIGTWQDVANILNDTLDKNWNECTYRKKYSNFNKMLDGNKELILKDNNYIKQLEKEQEAIRKERIKLQTLNVERNRIDRAEARQELFYEYVGQAVSTLPLPDFKLLPPVSTISTETYYLCCISDTHYGATFKCQNNEYSPSIFEDRLSHLGNYLVNFIQEKHINKIHIACLGDTLQGLLRVSDLKLNDSSLVVSLVNFSRLIASFLNEISAYAVVEYYHVPTSNHTQMRPFSTKANEIPDEDLEYVVSNYIKDLCKFNERIFVNIADSGKQYLVANIPLNNVYMMHGHTIKNFDSALKDLSELVQDTVDYLVIGHYHTGIEKCVSEGICHDKEILVCPSFVGSDPYADSLMKGSHPSVKIYGFNELYGHTETYKYILD